MGPDGSQAAVSDFTDKVPPSFAGRSNYASYREDVLLWTKLTSLDSSKQGPALVGRLSGEAKASAKSVPLEKICDTDGVAHILARLDKSYAVDSVNQLDADLASFLDYSWNKSSSVEQYIAGFHSRLDKVVSLNLDDKLKGHLLLRQAALTPQEKNMLVGAASGNYDVQRLTAALRNAYINVTPVDATMRSQENSPNSTRVDSTRFANRPERRHPNRSAGPARPTFYTFKTTSAPPMFEGAVLDSGACGSVVGKKALDRAMSNLGLNGIPEASIAREHHRFGDHPEAHRTISAVKFPFTCTDERDGQEAQFDIQFDIIDGELPFLVGLPSLIAMRACLNFKFKHLGLMIGSKYLKIPLHFQDSHVLLPFSSTIKRSANAKAPHHHKSGNNYPAVAKALHTAPDARVSNEPSMYSPSIDSLIKKGISTYSPSKPVDSPSRSLVEKTTSMYNPSKSSFNKDISLYKPANARDIELSGTYNPRDSKGGIEGNCAHKSKSAETNDTRNIGRTAMTDATRRRSFSNAELLKLHTQLKHATKSQLSSYLKTADMWYDGLLAQIEGAISGCKCRLAFPPTPHAVASSTPPGTEVQCHLSVDVINLEGHNFLHCLDRASGWSEIGMLSRKDLAEQVRVFRRIQANRHGIPRSIHCDREYNKGAFQQYCDEMHINIVPVAAHSHESNGAIERANRTLRSYFNRLRKCDRKSPTSEIASEAVYGKNINNGSHLASAFQLLYKRSPRISGTDKIDNKPVPSIQEHSAHVARQRVNTLLRTNIRDPYLPAIGETVYFWRDGSGWLGPAKVQKVDPNIITVRHNGVDKTSSFNRIRSLTEHGPPNERDNQPMAATVQAELDAEDSSRASVADGLPESALDLSEDHDLDQPMPCDPVADIPHPLPQPSQRHTIPAAEARELIREGSEFLNRNTASRYRTRSTTASRSGNGSATNSSNITGCSRSSDQNGTYFVETSANEDMYDPDASVEAPRRAVCEINDTMECAPRSSGESVPNGQEMTFASRNENASDKSPDLPATHDRRALTESERSGAFARELQSWIDIEAYVPVPIKEAPPGSNVIGSHTVFRRKDDGSVKARIVPWGHRDSERDELRSDSPCVNLDTFRLVLSIAAEHAWVLGQMDIKTAFLQAKGFDRDVYVRPPKEADDKSRYWKLLAPAYGLTDSGRLWYRTSDQALITDHNLTRSRYEATLYYRHSDNHKLTFLLVAQVDNYIYAGDEREMTSFESFLQNRFRVGALDRASFDVMGCELTQSPDGSVTLRQSSRLADLDPSVLLPPVRQLHRSPKRSATEKELHSYRSALGQMLYIGRMSHPLMLSHASAMATKVSDLHTDHIRLLQSHMKSDKASAPSLLFNHPPNQGDFSLEAISDASMSSASEGGGRGACVVVRRSGDIIHPIFWSSRKLRRVARSSSTAELLAASDAVSRLIYLQALVAEISYHHTARLVVDSRALLNLATSIREPAEVVNKLDLAIIREAFTPRLVAEICWAPGHYNIADGLTKENRDTGALLNKTLREGRLPPHAETIMHTAEHEIQPSSSTPFPKIVDVNLVTDENVATKMSQKGGV